MPCIPLPPSWPCVAAWEEQSSTLLHAWPPAVATATTQDSQAMASGLRLHWFWLPPWHVAAALESDTETGLSLRERSCSACPHLAPTTGQHCGPRSTTNGSDSPCFSVRIVSNSSWVQCREHCRASCQDPGRRAVSVGAYTCVPREQETSQSNSCSKYFQRSNPLP